MRCVQNTAMPTASPSIRCAQCGGAAHSASGCQYSERTVICGPCVRRWWAWYVKHVNGKGARSGIYFYEHAQRPEVREKG